MAKNATIRPGRVRQRHGPATIRAVHPAPALRVGQLRRRQLVRGHSATRRRARHAQRTAGRTHRAPAGKYPY